MMEWNIQARSRACQECQQTFEDKQACHTMLFFQEEGYQRLDVCQACWLKRFSKGAPESLGYVSYWQGVYATPPAPSEPIEKETAESLLRKLVASPNPDFGPARYILAAMLERKRQLKVTSEVREGGARIFVYEHARTGEVFQIPDPKLDLAQWDQVRQDIARLMERGLSSEEALPHEPQADAKPDQEQEQEQDRDRGRDQDSVEKEGTGVEPR